MPKRRSLDEALTPDEETFLKAGARPTVPPAEPIAQPDKQEEPPMPRPITLKESIPQDTPPPVRPIKSASPAKGTPGNGAINARIDPAITTALMRASFERRLEGKTPSTHREIIAEALKEWLKKNGY